MNLKDEFLPALRSGKDHEVLADIVCRHIDTGSPEREAYNLLEQIWLDFGFNNSDEESDLRNELEFMMERVWYFGRPR